MALQQLQLDNFTWAEMVTSIRRRIPAASSGEWTLHAPVDPGVTLLELFAYMLEQRVFWLDQIPDSLVRAALNLMGAETRPAGAATTVMKFLPRDFVEVADATEVRLAKRQPPLIFSTDSDVLLLPCDEIKPGRYRVALSIGGRDRTLDLLNGRRVCLLPALAREGDVEIMLPLTKPLPNNPGPDFGNFFSLLVELSTSERVPPQWSWAAVDDVPAPAVATWWYRDSISGNLKQFPADAIEDGTIGLRRSGLVRLRVPPSWQYGPGATGTFDYTLVLRIVEATFTTPPVISRLVPNVVIARHARQTQEHTLTFEWLPLPGNVVALPDLYTGAPLGSGLAPLQDYPPLEDSIKLTLKERDGEFEWHSTSSLTFRGPDERVFVVDREQGLLRFGNGLTGRVPVLDRGAATNVTLEYLVGGGQAGNVGANLDFEHGTDPDLKATNIVPGQGGTETESLDSASRFAAAMLERVERAITANDHEAIVIETPGVDLERAHAALGQHPAHPCQLVPGAVSIYVVPGASREGDLQVEQDCAHVAAPIPDAGALQAARARIDKARLIGSEVFVLPAEYRDVTLLIDAEGDPVDPVGLNTRIRLHLQTFLDPLRGGPQQSGWPFGEPLRPSVLLSEAQKAAGDEASITSVAIGLDCNSPSESCKDVEIKPYQLPVLRDVSVRLRTDVITTGGLR